MRNRALHDALRDFALEAAAHLTEEVEGGAELAFDVIEQPARGSTLYTYKPLTGDFIAHRWRLLRQLEACHAAAEALGSGAELYLRIQGADKAADAEPALRTMLERLYSDASSFAFPEERFERVYAELERALYADTLRTAIVTPVHGLDLESERIEFGDGLFLIGGTRVDAPREAVWGTPSAERDSRGEPNVLFVLRRDVEADAPLPVAEARLRFGVLGRALRLIKAGGTTLGPLAWGRVDDGSWQAMALPGSGGGRAHGMVLAAEEEEELRALFERLTRTRPRGRVAWAFRRFEMGLERMQDTEALSDYVLAASALFEANDEAGRLSVPLRLAALCAEERTRAYLARRIEKAFACERLLAAGHPADAAEAGEETPRSLSLALEECLRAVLRDMLYGYLPSDLKGAADEILIASGGALPIHAADLRATPGEFEDDVRPGPHEAPEEYLEEGFSAEEAEPELAEDLPPGAENGTDRGFTAGEPEPEPADDLRARSDAETDAEADADTGELPRIELDRFAAAGVTESSDWYCGDDEDAGSYSAPV